MRDPLIAEWRTGDGAEIWRRAPSGLRPGSGRRSALLAHVMAAMKWSILSLLRFQLAIVRQASCLPWDARIRRLLGAGWARTRSEAESSCVART